MKQHSLIIALSALPAGESEHWNQVLPAGRFRTINNDEFEVTEADGPVLASAMNTQTNDLVCDYEHGTLLKAAKGEANPAAGWFRKWEWRAGVGLFALTAWTQAAATAIQNGEYRYLSPMFTHVGRKITRLLPAGITNYPAIDGMQPLAASASVGTSSTMEKSMEELIKRLRELLGLAEDATPEQMLEALNRWVAEQDKAKESVTAASAVNLSQYAPIAIVTQLQAKVAELSANSAAVNAQKLVDDALADGRLLPGAMLDHAKSLKGDVVALSAFLNALTPIAALSALQTANVKSQAAASSQGLSETEKSICKQLQISEADFIKQREASNARTRR